MNNPIKVFHALAQKNALELGDAITAIGLCSALVHFLFYFVTEHAGESNSVGLRALAILSLIPAIARHPPPHCLRIHNVSA